MKMTCDNIRDYLLNVVSHITFEYNEKKCGIDPFSNSDFDVWCGDDCQNVKSIDEVMGINIFDGKSLNEIAAEIDFD